ncbi:glycosyltransferase family 2 protein [Helicobacter winghamensis]|uniref:glycosyltransferase family 2 protein n=1 Tax=Helicobacter winghamensis TaxID=157268 RepID=UPI0027A4BB43
MDKVKVSIIIPVYNVEKYIAECLESCIYQTLKEIEIIVVDDCGNDRSIEIAREYASRDSRIKIVKNTENQKLMLARFEGAKEAKADYIMFLDSDDFLDLNACEIAYNASKEGYYDIISFGLKFYNQGKVEPFSAYDSQNFETLDNFSNWFYRLKHPTCNLCGRLIKKEIYHLGLESLGIGKKQKKITYAEDMLASFAIFNFCKTFCYLSEILYYYRYNAESSTQCKTLENLKCNANDLLQVIEIIKNFATYKICNERLVKYFLQQARHELSVIDYCIKDREGILSLWDRVLYQVYGRFYVIRRKLRVRLGI